MFTKRQKKLLSHVMRDFVKHKTWIVETDSVSLRDKWRWVRSPWDDETSIQYTITSCLNYRDACEWVDEMVDASRQSLPEWDCSGQSFISHTHVGRTNMPHKFVVILYWSLDV